MLGVQAGEERSLQRRQGCVRTGGAAGGDVAPVAAVMAATPRVSVGIPTYRGAATLGAAIESVLAQTLTDFELIVVDDSSPDETAAVVERFDDPRLKYHRNVSNLGPEGNWNRCLSLARGTYFKLLPHDDVLQPECLQRQVAALDADTLEQIALVFTARDVLGPDGRKLTTRGYPSGREGRIAAQQVMRKCIRRGTNLLGEPGAVLFRTSTAHVVGTFDATHPYVIDLDYWFRLLTHGDAHYLPQPLAAFRVSGGQWSVALYRRQSLDFHGFVADVLRRTPLPLNLLDRLGAALTPALNQAARIVFYRMYLR